MKLALTFITGLVIGVVSLASFNFWNARSTEIWTSKTELITDSGMLIPEGTELQFLETMPEGYAALSLAINVEGAELGLFQKAVIDKPNLRSPVWLQENN